MSGTSGCVVARDAAATLGRCLASLSFCDECVVVVDPRSRDATEAIARAAGARVLLHPYAGNLEQKRFALAQCKGPWAVLLDADGVLLAKGLVNTREHIESLFEAARLGVASMQEWLQEHDDVRRTA